MVTDEELTDASRLAPEELNLPEKPGVRFR